MNFCIILSAVLVSLAFSSITLAKDLTDQCVIPTNIPAQPSIDTWLELEPFLEHQFDLCLDSSPYFALYGASLLYTGKVVHALEMLERALLINPDNASARLDYAEALYQSGQLINALELNQQLISDPTTPDQVIGFLSDREMAWEKKTVYWDNDVSYLHGYSSNLNNATSNDFLNLNLSGQLVAFRLDSDSQAKAGAYNYYGFRTQRNKIKTDGYSRLNFSVKSRDSLENDSDADEFRFLYELNRELLGYQRNWTLGLKHISYGNRGLYNAMDAKWRHTLKAHLNPYIEISGEYVNFIGQDILDEFFLIIRPGISYRKYDQTFGVEIGVGVNKEIDSRLGGDRTQKEASLFYDSKLFRGHLTARLDYVKSIDSTNYSPLFGTDLRRKVSTFTKSIEYHYPITKNILVHTGLYNRTQESNIDLFDTKTESIDLGFTYRF